MSAADLSFVMQISGPVPGLFAGNFKGEKECHEDPREDDEEQGVFQDSNKERGLFLLPFRLFEKRRCGIGA